MVFVIRLFGLSFIKKQLDRGVEKEKWDETFATDCFSKITGTQDISDLRDCDLVVEAATENKKVKLEIFKNLDDESIKKFHSLCIVQHHTKIKSRLEEIYKNSLIPLIYDCQNNLVKDRNSKTLLKFFGDK